MTIHATTKPDPPTLFERIGGCRPLGVLIRNFYLSLQANSRLGPIFDRHVESWPRHYETLTDFWTLQTGGPAAYRGRFLQAHVRLDLCPMHLDLWLAQWRQSCRLHFAEPEAAEMIVLAERLGARLRETVVAST